MQYIQEGAGRGPGLGGDGSQTAGTPSETSPDLHDGETHSDNPGGSESAAPASSVVAVRTAIAALMFSILFALQ